MLSVTDATHEYLFPRGEHPLGRSWEEWTCRWWEWILSIPRVDNPGYDKTGERISKNQHSEVLFLPGTFGGIAERHISIPASKPILLPVINCTTSFAEEPRFKTEFQLMEFVRSQIDDIGDVHASIDGVELKNVEQYRVRSRIFDVLFPENNVYNAKPGQTRAASDGFWLFLKPLSPGLHQIHTYGSCLLGKIRIEVKYNMRVQ